ncbi:MAG: hypothetical protein H7A05_06085 [Pseudomonadales bacterium]|nr:hypothetical protein [Pseudomonadales bacterium]MCP5330212.1 hypothetical protein [Pseudomonadales bacterium]MCP5344171.1 hypothetical protein [Pseudomonadales bacterium]
MKCVYYLSPTLKSTQQISDDLHEIGVDDWFLHIVSKDESGLSKQKLHSSNYIETLDVIRDGLIGAACGLCAGIAGALITRIAQPFGPDVHWFAYLAIVFVWICFGAWVGGLVGIASENKKLAKFRNDIEAGKYLVLIYAKQHQEEKVHQMMASKHPEAELAAVDANFLNPFTELKMTV